MCIFQRLGDLPTNVRHRVKEPVCDRNVRWKRRPQFECRSRGHAGIRAGRSVFSRQACRCEQSRLLSSAGADHGGQALALDKLHRIIVHAALATDGKDWHDMRMVQMRGRFRLVAKALQLPAVRAGGKRQNL